MHHEARDRATRLLVIADDDEAARKAQAEACAGAGLQVATAAIDGDAAGLAAVGELCALVISLATDAGLHLLQELSRDPRTGQIPVVVSACRSDQARARAEQAGTVAIFLDQPSPPTLAAAVIEVMRLREADGGTAPEFPVRCLRCSASAGMPRSVSTVLTAGTYVGLECRECNLSWRVLRPDGTAAPRTPS